MCRHRSIFPGRFQPSIFDTNELNYRVRDGNGWTLVVINTDFEKRCRNGSSLNYLSDYITTVFKMQVFFTINLKFFNGKLFIPLQAPLKFRLHRFCGNPQRNNCSLYPAPKIRRDSYPDTLFFCKLSRYAPVQTKRRRPH